MITSGLSFLPGLILRTPLLSYAEPDGGPEDYLPLAVYLASPVFYAALAARGFQLEGLREKEKLSLEKYLNRMRYRPTPFGSFAAFSYVRWGEPGVVVLPDTGKSLLHLLPDQGIRHTLASALPRSSFELNPTLYRVGKEFRYIKSVLEDGGTKYDFLLESFEAGPLNRKLCSWLLGAPQAGERIIAFLVAATACGADEACSYLEFLEAAQIIRTTGGLHMIGADEQRLAEMPGEAQLPGKKVPSLTVLSLAGQYIPAMEAVRRQAAPAGNEPGTAFYANTERKVISGGLSYIFQEQLSGALKALTKLSAAGGPVLLEKFKKDFIDRFDRQKIPLMEALDPETGVGYGNLAGGSIAGGLLNGLPFPAGEGAEESLNWSAAHRLLLGKWLAIPGSDPVIRLYGEDILSLPAPRYPLPPGLSVMFRLAEDGLLLENAGGVTATALIGRFTSFSAEIHQLAREAATAECAGNPGVIFADIGQLSDLHVDNINRRLPVFPFEIPINSISLLPRDQQLLPADLLVSASAGGVFLESRRLGKRVIPRLSSAYNFRHNNLAVFRFLCDLQFQGVQADLGFDLENFFPKMGHYPRVQFGEVILSPAKWRLENAGEAPELLRQKLALPRYISLTRFDQELTFDLDDPASRSFFQRCVSGLTGFTLQEALLPSPGGSAAVTESGNPLVNQWIALLTNRQRVYEALVPVPGKSLKAERQFVLGSRWVYLKIYCTPLTADELLTGSLLPALQKLSAGGMLDGWFFIRYTDPDYHLRLRLKTREDVIGRVLGLLKKQLYGVFRDRLVREYQADTYRRELERYGPDLMEAVEVFFGASSELVLHFLKKNRVLGLCADHFAVSGFATILNIMLPGTGEQLRFLELGWQRFFSEFKGDKALRISLDVLYREKKAELFASSSLLPDKRLRLGQFHRLFRLRVKQIAAKLNQDETRRQGLAADLIHMHLNRIYRSEQRRREFVLYYFFYKYQQSLKGRLKRSGQVIA